MIIFEKDISIFKLLLAYNNNNIVFHSDSALAIKNAAITGLGINALIYPGPNGKFRFPFKEWITSEINTNYFADDLQYNLNSLDPDSFIYDIADGCYLEGDVVIQINFLNGSNENVTKNLKFIAGCENLESFKKDEVLFSENDIVILSPGVDRTNNEIILNYWEGYPFEFTIYNSLFPIQELNIKNKNTGISFNFILKGKVNSIFISDGDLDNTLENFVPLAIGYNSIELKFNDVIQPVNLNDVIQPVNLLVNKIQGECGYYLKFLNKYGRWSYWLFDSKAMRSRSVKYTGEVDSDFNNLEDTISPFRKLGNNSQDTLRLAVEGLEENEFTVLKDITESLKIFLFTGTAFSKGGYNDWVEVERISSSFTLIDNHHRHNLSLDVQLPQRYTISL
jgi:hypothetical protein